MKTSSLRLEKDRGQSVPQEKFLTIDDRGTPLHAVVREMPVAWREAWFMKAVRVLATAGSSVPFGADFAAVARYFREGGVAAFGNVNYDEAKALLDGLLECVSLIGEDGSEVPLTLETADERIRSVNTLLQLRLEALMLNINGEDNCPPAASLGADSAQDTCAPIQ